MVHEGALLESQTLRASVAERTEALDKVKLLSLLPDGLHVTTRMVANYFEVADHVVSKVVQRHREELTENGMRTLRGSELRSFERDNLSSSDGSYPQGRAHLTLFTRRAVLNVAMLLRDSDVARQVRTYLLDTEHRSRAAPSTTPVDNSVFHSLVEWLDQRIAQAIDAQQQAPRALDEAYVRDIAEGAVRDVMGQVVVPLLNRVIESQSDMRRQLADYEAEMVQFRCALREREAAASMAALDAMSARDFERHVAWLCRRDGCAQVTVTGGQGDGADILGYTSDGRRLVVQCKARTPNSSITSGDVQSFIGMAKVDYKADVALLVATAPFSREALLVSSQHEVTAVHRGLLEAWSNGTKLHVLE